MRKPKDFDSELKALDERAKQLRTRKLQQLGELVVATGADALPLDMLTGALLAATGAKDAAVREGWRTQGATFFHGTARTKSPAPEDRPSGALDAGGTLPFDRQARPAG